MLSAGAFLRNRPGMIDRTEVRGGLAWDSLRLGMNRGQSSAKKKRPRKSAPKRGVSKLTPKRFKAIRALSISGADVTASAREPLYDPPSHEDMEGDAFSRI